MSAGSVIATVAFAADVVLTLVLAYKAGLRRRRKPEEPPPAPAEEDSTPGFHPTTLVGSGDAEQPNDRHSDVPDQTSY